MFRRLLDGSQKPPDKWHDQNVMATLSGVFSVFRKGQAIPEERMK